MNLGYFYTLPFSINGQKYTLVGICCQWKSRIKNETCAGVQLVLDTQGSRAVLDGPVVASSQAHFLALETEVQRKHLAKHETPQMGRGCVGCSLLSSLLLLSGGSWKLSA